MGPLRGLLMYFTIKAVKCSGKPAAVTPKKERIYSVHVGVHREPRQGNNEEDDAII